MEKVIKKLVDLAYLYKAYGKEINLHQTWNDLDTKFTEENLKVSVYFANNYDTCTVRFGEVEITLYANKITMPWDYSKEDLEAIYTSADKIYNMLLVDKDDSRVQKRLMAQKERIAELEAELAALKGSDDMQV